MTDRLPSRWWAALAVPLLVVVALSTSLPLEAGARRDALLEAADAPSQQAWTFIENVGQYDAAARYLLLSGP
jgi:hypothetical protein